MSDNINRDELKKIESELEAFLSLMRKEVIHKLSNTDKEHLTEIKFKSAVSSSRKIS